MPSEQGVLLVRAGRRGRQRVVAWVRRGTLPVYVLPAGEDGWFGVVPAGPSQAPAPYDSGAPMLVGHPVPARLRPAIGLFVVGHRAIVSVSAAGWRQVTRWVAWTPGEGCHPMPGLPLAGPHHVASAAGFTTPEAAREAGAVLTDPAGRAERVLVDLAGVLHLPFADACSGTSGAQLPGAELVGPPAVSITRFTDTVSEEKRLERELEEGL